MLLRRGCIIKKIFNVRSYKDRRKKIDRYIYSYHDEYYVEYREGFEFPVGTDIQNVKVPETITL